MNKTVRFTSTRKSCWTDDRSRQPPADDLLEDVEELNEDEEEAAVAAAAAAVVDDDEDDEWESDEDSMSSSKKKRVVFKGTYPIDRPLVGRSTVNSRKRQQMALTLRSPRTYVIDEPIGVVGVERKGHVVEVSIRLGLSTSASISMSFPILHFLVTCLFIYMLLIFFFFFYIFSFASFYRQCSVRWISFSVHGFSFTSAVVWL